jgi:hypothetical protein
MPSRDDPVEEGQMNTKVKTSERYDQLMIEKSLVDAAVIPPDLLSFLQQLFKIISRKVVNCSVWI